MIWELGITLKRFRLMLLNAQSAGMAVVGCPTAMERRWWGTRHPTGNDMQAPCDLTTAILD